MPVFAAAVAAIFLPAAASAHKTFVENLDAFTNDVAVNKIEGNRW